MLDYKGTPGVSAATLTVNTEQLPIVIGRALEILRITAEAIWQTQCGSANVTSVSNTFPTWIVS